MIAALGVVSVASLGGTSFLLWERFHADSDPANAMVAGPDIGDAYSGGETYDNSSALALGKVEGDLRAVETQVAEARKETQRAQRTADSAATQAEEAIDKHRNLCIVHSIC